MECQGLFSLKQKTPSDGFVFEALSDLVYCSYFIP